MTAEEQVNLAEVIAGIDPTLDPEEQADAVLASPAVVALQARAWDDGFRAGTRHARPRF